MAAPFVYELDRPRELKFTIGMAAKFEQMTGKKIKGRTELFTVEENAKALMLMLQREDPRITLGEVYDILEKSDKSIDDIEEAVAEAVVRCITGKTSQQLMDSVEEDEDPNA